VRIVNINKADGIGDAKNPGVTIVIDEVMMLKRADDMREQYQQFEQQGSMLEFHLHKTLPGGTYDQLAIAILCRIATQLRASHDREATNASNQ